MLVKDSQLGGETCSSSAHGDHNCCGGDRSGSDGSSHASDLKTE
jgi:hypothetical protein